jgi:chromosome segregation protein
MLKRLELIGFKSFADKTQFDFPAGITAIVGPNGSGKSNVVDAVRWVLGEQSAKSLRGGEMADVIFNGSTSRRSLGMAEVTMTFDNRQGTLALDAEEVQITRRVYRDGQGEYLINHEPRRLKDIRDLFLGSGAGTDAYCVIEQGRVDVLLQASTRDRRSIFEEAAGVSRFKVRKIETLRKLERVDQNLDRLRDIVDEVEKQLRSVKLQAAKAQRYQEHTQRLKELRVAQGLQEYGELDELLVAQTSLLEGLRAELSRQASELQTWEDETSKLEHSLAAAEDAIHAQEGLLAQARQQIAAEQTTLEHEGDLSKELEQDLKGSGARLTDLNAKVAHLTDAARTAANDVRAVETETDAQRQSLARCEHALEATISRLALLQQEVQTDKANHFELVRKVGRLQNDASTFKTQMDHLGRDRDRLKLKTELATQSLAALELELTELNQADDSLQARTAHSRQTLSSEREELERSRGQREQLSREIAQLQAQRSGIASRIEVLQGLERSHEGLGSGVREILALIKQPEPGPWRAVLGIVADFLDIKHEFAALIDIALGERAQAFLVSSADWLERAILEIPAPLSGRVTFLPPDPGQMEAGCGPPNRLTELSETARLRLPVSPDGTPVYPGIVARADRLVSCGRAELGTLPYRLLGTTLIVQDLAAARTISAHTTGYRFVTLRGDLLEADGTLTVGSHHGDAGILSRRSELRELCQEALGIEGRISETRASLESQGGQQASLEARIQNHLDEIEMLAGQAADLRSRIGQRRQHQQGLHEEVVLGRTEIDGIELEIQKLLQGWRQAQEDATEAEGEVHALETRLESNEREIHECERQRQQKQQECMAAKVAAAQVEERLQALRSRLAQIETDLEQRTQEKLQGEQQLQLARSRLTENRMTMLRASAELAEWFLKKEASESSLAVLQGDRDARRAERQSLAQRVQAARASWRERQDQAHARELQVHDTQHRQSTLSERLREDYQLDLAELARSSRERGGSAADGSSDTDPETVEVEIQALRGKLSRLGSVNLEAVQELAELDMRAGNLRTQFEDLSEAKRSLEEIIAKINHDSRRLFTETFAVIRSHFQELFRKLFGGGMADIVLEDESDVLESGVEIIARPPGKELRSISLMSGGEKTMTAVALLLAIFRSKPCPFCILDEVDAALDEANIGRFTAVLGDFLDRSHFIIITHSKRTMTIADVLYGITMQESGVSKLVAVRLGDWPDDPQTGVTLPAARAG